MTLTYACGFDGVCNFEEQLLILGAILASYEDFDRESAAFDLVEVLGWELCQGWRNQRVLFPIDNIPFFCVVRMYRVSSVKSISVVGNS